MKSLILILVLSLITDLTFAQTSSTTTTRLRNRTGPDRGVEDINLGPIASGVPNNLEDIVEFQLLNAQQLSSQINWPALPRIWVPRYISRSFEGEVSVGANIYFTGVKASFNYKYNVKTTLWLISSTRPTNSLPGPVPQVSFNMSENEDFFIQGNKGLLYPNVREHFPIVGLCIYEISLDLTNTRRGFFDFFGTGLNLLSQDAVGGSFATWSNFFNTQKDTPVKTYLSRDCEGFFNKNVKDYTERNFSKLAVELYSLYHPKNTCSVNGESTDVGDTDCMEWHSRLSSRKKEATVPRCEMNNKGISHCVLKSKQKAQCPLWYDTRKNYTSTNINGDLELATSSLVSRECDYGLTCRAQPIKNTYFEKLKSKLRISSSARCE